MHRFFVPADSLRSDLITLSGDTARQIHTVLRMRPGARLMLLDNQGWEYTVELGEVSAKNVTAHLIERAPAEGEPRLQVTLYQSLLKRENFEWVLQKSTEIGVADVVPFVSSRTVVTGASSNKQGRWLSIVTEAAEQSRRGRIPRLHEAMSFADALTHAQAHPLKIIPYEGESTRSLPDTLTDFAPEQGAIAVFIGAEGGFSEAEIAEAEAAGVIPVTLGKRILRAETAALYTLSALFARLENIP